MKQLTVKYRKPLWILSLIGLLLLLGAPSAMAENRQGDVVLVKSGEVIDDDLYAFGQEIIIDGVVKGDLIAAGQSVTVNGAVEGDLIAGAQGVTVNGEVGDDMRAGGYVILVKGKVADDANLAGFSLETGPESDIGGDLFAGAFQGLMAGEIGGGIFGGFSRLQIAGDVGGDVNVDIGGDEGPGPIPFIRGMPNVPPMPTVPSGLTLTDGASVAGDLTYRSPSPATIRQASVAGQVNFNQQVSTQQRFKLLTWVVDQVQRLLRLLLVGALAIWLAPAFVGQASRALQEKLWPSLGWGALALIIFPFALAVVGLIGWVVDFPLLPFATFLFSFLLVFFYIGAVVVGQWLGRRGLERFNSDLAGSDIWTTALGLVVVWLVTLIPILGGIVGFIVALFGLGGLSLAARARMQRRPAEAASGGPMPLPTA